jgi:type IV pilus assembly protein PilC
MTSVVVLVTIGLLVFVVPQFQALFKDFGGDLPWFTLLIINLSDVLQHQGYILFIAMICMCCGFIYTRKNSPAIALGIDRLKLKLIIIGTLYEQTAIARFARTLAITFAAGLPLTEALDAVTSVTGNLVYAKALTKMKEEIYYGQTIHQAMKNTHLFPSMAIQMIAIGEETGSLEAMLCKVADFYEQNVDHTIYSLSHLLEPIIMTLLGIIVGGLIIAMYLPIFKLGAVI